MLLAPTTLRAAFAARRIGVAKNTVALVLGCDHNRVRRIDDGTTEEYRKVHAEYGRLGHDAFVARWLTPAFVDACNRVERRHN